GAGCRTRSRRGAHLGRRAGPGLVDRVPRPGRRPRRRLAAWRGPVPVRPHRRRHDHRPLRRGPHRPQRRPPVRGDRADRSRRARRVGHLRRRARAGGRVRRPRHGSEHLCQGSGRERRRAAHLSGWPGDGRKAGRGDHV
ncbi:MAG: hypothetical protein AVDCRST_MAG50-3248, partial [uncultured Acidimicrobiales bacterium]